MRKKFSIIAALLLTAAFIVSSLASCKPTDTDEKSRVYDFVNYESDEVFDIEKVNLSKELAAECESYSFTYLSDGLKIKAYISIPLSTIESQEPTQCVLYNRGGNRNYGALGKYDTAAICKACKRVVVASQYRGGGGSEGKDEFGGSDMHDVIKLIDLCANRFSFVDMDDFCAAGISRGGMMAYLAAKQDKRVKRVIAVSAVSNLLRSYKERDDMQKVLKGTIGFTPEENPDAYKERSAVYWYKKIKVPVLMIHSKLDKQVSYKQAEQLYTRLKQVTDCTFITYSDDVHGLHNNDEKTIYKWLNKNAV